MRADDDDQRAGDLRGEPAQHESTAIATAETRDVAAFSVAELRERVGELAEEALVLGVAA